jgi:hypothetical protein
MSIVKGIIHLVLILIIIRGRLIPKRQNYDFKDPEYLKVKSRMWWRIYSLGYSLDKFGEIDKDIARDRYRLGRAENVGKIDRYGKNTVG